MEIENSPHSSSTRSQKQNQDATQIKYFIESVF